MTNHGVDPSIVDFGIVARWMDEQGLPSGEIESVEALAGGTQNVMLKFRRGGRSFVLRRGPPHLRPRSNDVIRREMRVLSALAGSDVPHPGFIAGCGGGLLLDGTR
jgi:aminoglycoside phosphotransferase (APT) family kinase protein